jgi:pimeloyl-ACP methyl ester carboxylesterase
VGAREVRSEGAILLGDRNASSKSCPQFAGGHQMTGAIVDSFITSLRHTKARKRGVHESSMRYIQTRAAELRVVDTGGGKPTLVLTPDGPCVIEHYDGLIKRFSEQFRVICFDMPGVGFSFPSYGYRFAIAEPADFIVELLDALSVPKAAFAFTCANGFFAMNLAKRYPERVSHLILAQTPSLESMRRWADRNIPRPLRIPYVGQAVGAIKAEFLATHWFSLALPRGSEHKGDFVAQARQALHDGGCFCLASLVQGLLQTQEDDVRGVQCPTLAIHGDSDFSHKYTDFRSVTDDIPHAQLIAFHGCGHFPNLERGSEYIDHVQRFLLG